MTGFFTGGDVFLSAFRLPVSTAPANRTSVADRSGSQLVNRCLIRAFIIDRRILPAQDNQSGCKPNSAHPAGTAARATSDLKLIAPPGYPERSSLRHDPRADLEPLCRGTNVFKLSRNLTTYSLRGSTGTGATIRLFRRGEPLVHIRKSIERNRLNSSGSQPNGIPD